MLSQDGEALPRTLEIARTSSTLSKRAMLTKETAASLPLPSHEPAARRWFAVLTTPKHEKAAVKHLDFAGVETFLPTYESPRVWKNRQKVNVQLPLFPTYLFVRIDHQDRGKVLRAPGVRQLVGTRREALPLPDQEIEFLRNSLCEQKAEPYLGLVVGQRVRIKSGAMQGVEGCLIRKNSGWRFVLTVEIIHQHVAVEVDASTLEPILN